MEHVLMHTFRSSEPQFFPPWKETQEPPSTRDSSSIGKWISCMARADLRARQGNQSAKRIGVSSFFLFFFQNSLERIVNKLARHNPDQGRDGIVSWKKRKNVARFSHPTFREPFESRRADGWRTDHLAVTTIVRRRCY